MVICADFDTAMQSKIAIFGALLVVGGIATGAAAQSTDIPSDWPASAPHEPAIFLYSSANTAPAPLARGEIVETQRLLAAQGYKPGPIDGAVGPRTLDAASRYRVKHDMAETATLDRPLLDRLRAEAGPRVAQRAPNTTSHARSSSDPFLGFRQAGQRVAAWFNSIGH